MNGYYGKHLERHIVKNPEHKNYGKFETGNFFNPFYGSYILGNTRLMIYKALKQIDIKNIVGCSTDSIFCSEPISMSMGKGLGEWDIANIGEMLIMGCGVYCIRGKTVKQKTRGFHVTEKSKGEKTLFDHVKEQHKKEKVTLPINVNVTLGNSLRQHVPNDMNLIREEAKDIYINFDTKRLWTKQFKNAGELLEKSIDSFPLPYGTIGH